MLTISNFDKLNGYFEGRLCIQSIEEDEDVYRIFVEYEFEFINVPIYIGIARNKRTDVDPKFPLDKTPVYDVHIIQRFDDGRVKRKDLGIKKKALESSDNIIKALNEMLDDFVNER
jgi:hypothetical protein